MAARSLQSGLRAPQHEGNRGPSLLVYENGPLTQREQEILALFCQGMSYAQIAEVRRVKPVTIRNAIYAIQSKLEMGSKQEMVVWAVQNGLLDDQRTRRRIIQPFRLSRRRRSAGPEGRVAVHGRTGALGRDSRPRGNRFPVTSPASPPRAIPPACSPAPSWKSRSTRGR